MQHIIRWPLALVSVLTFLACGKDNNDSDKKYHLSGSMTVDGRTRTYWLNLPPGYDAGKDYSLVVALHGGGGSGEQFEESSRLSVKADKEKFIVVYPDGVQSDGLLRARTWNAGTCCDFAVEQNINDVKYISELIDKLMASYKINPQKVYATGHSNGGMMSYRLACELSNKITAIAPNGCSMALKTPCTATRAVPILHMHSVRDENVPYKGGFGSGVSNTYFPPVDSVLNVWSTINGCAVKKQTNAVTAQYTQWTWSNCTGNSSIQWYLTLDGGHAWPGGLPGRTGADQPATSISANDLLWSFFQQYQLP